MNHHRLWLNNFCRDVSVIVRTFEWLSGRLIQVFLALFQILIKFYENKQIKLWFFINGRSRFQKNKKKNFWALSKTYFLKNPGDSLFVKLKNLFSQNAQKLSTGMSFIKIRSEIILKNITFLHITFTILCWSYQNSRFWNNFMNTWVSGWD